MTDRVVIRWVGLPIVLCRNVVQHHEALFRELRLITLAGPQERAGVPVRLIALAAAVDDRGLRLGGIQLEQLEASHQRGDASMDLELELDSHAVQRSQALEEILIELDDFCRRGELLTLASPPEFVELRTWMLDEIVRQSNGDGATPWLQYRAANEQAASRSAGPKP